MNPRRIHQLMRQHFPALWQCQPAWVCVPEGLTCTSHLEELLAGAYAPDALLLIHVRRKVGAALPRHMAAPYIAQHIGTANIRIADRCFTAFTAIAQSSVAAVWRPTANESALPTD